MRIVRLLPALTVLMFALAACSSDESDSVDAGASASCEYVENSREGKTAELPPSEPLAAESATIATNLGDIVVALDPQAAPCTVNSFLSLAQQGYFDDTLCHRVVPGFVLQCGDPTATGTGGPGYSFDDELTGDESYTAGTFAMANAGPNTNGSQFFIVLEDSQLPAAYTVFGSVDEAGLTLAREVADQGNGPDGVAPAIEVRITSVS